MRVVPERVGPADLDVDEPVRRLPRLDRRAASETRDAVEAQPVLDQRADAHLDRAGRDDAKRRSGGVIASRLRASAKNAKTSAGSAVEAPARARGSRIGHATCLRSAARRDRPAVSARSRACARTTTSAATGRAARRLLRRLHLPALRAGRMRGCGAQPRPARLPPLRADGASTRARSPLAYAAEAAAARTRSGRSTTRSTPTRAASTTRTCGRARSALGLDLERFERDRRSAAVAERVQRDVRDGVAGRASSTTPTLLVATGRPAPCALAMA